MKKESRHCFLIICALFFLICPSAAADLLELTLDEAVSTALRENLSMEEAEIAIRGAEADIKTNMGEFDPALRFDIDASHSIEPTPTIVTSPEEDTIGYGVSFFGKARTGTEYEIRYQGRRTEIGENPFFRINQYYSTGVTLLLNQPLLKGFGTSVQGARVDASRKGLDAARLEAGHKAMEVIAETAAAYWQLYFARSDLEVAEDSLKLAENTLLEVRTKIKAGALAPVEVYKAEAEAAVRQERLLRAEKTVLDAEDALRALMDYEDWAREIIPIDSPPAPEDVPPLEGLLEAATGNRPDYLRALKDFEGKKILSRFYKNQKLPDLSLTAGAGLSGLDESLGNAVDDAASGDFYTFQAGVSLSIPLGNRSAAGRYLKAKREEEAARLNVERIKKTIVVEVREALRALRLAGESIKATGRTKVASEKRLQAEEERFRLGMATLNDVLRFQEEFAETLSSEVRASTDYARALVNLRKASGTLSPESVR